MQLIDIVHHKTKLSDHLFEVGDQVRIVKPTVSISVTPGLWRIDCEPCLTSLSWLDIFDPFVNQTATVLDVHTDQFTGEVKYSLKHSARIIRDCLFNNVMMNKA